MAIEEEIAVDVTGIGSVDALADALDKAAASAAKLRESMAGGSAGGAGGAGGADKMAASMDAAATKMSAAVDKMEASFAKLKTAGAEAGAAMGDIGKAGAESAAGLGDAAKGANDAAESYARLGKASRDSAAMLDEQAVAGGRAAKSSAEGAAGGTKFWGGLKTVMLGAGIAAAYGIDKAMKFQSQMLLLHTQAGVSTGDVKKMSQGALQISTQTGQSLTDVAESAYHVASNMASMGTSVPKMLEATKTAAEGAAVGHASMVDVTNALTAAIASGIPGVKNYSQAMGVLNKTVGSGDMSMQDLADAFGTGMVASVKGYGLSIKDVGAGLAVLGDNNIRGAKAGTDFRMAVQSLAVPAASAKKELAGLGLTTTSLATDMQSGGLLKALDDLTGKFKEHGVTAKTQGQVITDLFGKKAGVGLSILLGQMGRLNSKYPELTASANGFSKAWQATQQSPAQKWKELTAGLQANVTGFGTELLPAFSKAAGFADRLLSDINGSKSGAKDMAVAFGGVAALFTAKKLTSGVESAVKTAEAGLRVTGKVAQVLHIPGLSGLSNIGKNAGLDGAAAKVGGAGAELSGAAAELSGAAAELSGAAGRLAGEGALGGAAGKAGGAAAGAEGAAAGAEAGAAGAAEGEAVAAAEGAGAKGLLAKGGSLAAGLAGPAALAVALDAAVVAPALKGMKSGPGGKNWFENPFGMAGPHDKASSGNWLTSFSPYERLFSQAKAPAPPAAIPSGMSPMAAGRFGPATAPGPAAPATYPDGRPFYGEVPARPAVISATPAAPGKLAALSVPAPKPVKVPPPDTSAVSGAMAKVRGMMSQLGTASIKPVKIPAPDTSALDAAKGKAASAGSGITQAIQGAMHPAKMPPPNLSAAAAAAGSARADGANISAGLASGILGGEGAVVAAATQVGNAAAAAMAKGADTHSPSKKTIKTGKELSAGIVIGLQGGQDAVNAAATALGKNAAKATDIAAIDSNVAKLKADVKGDSGLVKWLGTQQSKLTGLAGQRTRLETEIADSQQIAQAAISGASIMNATSATSPSANEPQSWQNLVTGMQNQADTQSQFTAAVGDLKKKGLNATELNQIVQAGATSGLPIAQGIDAGGKQAITQLNAVQAKLKASSAKLGDEAAPVMYQAGKDATAGLAKGLKADLGQVDKDMKKIADEMVSAVQKHTGTAKAKAAKTAAGAAASTAAGSTAASGAGSASSAAGGGTGSLSHAAASLSSAAGSLSGAASALTAAASALHKDATAGTVHAHPVASAASGGAHPVAAAAASGGHGGGGTVHHTTNVTVQGTVTAERDLLNSLQTMQLKRASNNYQGGWKLPGRGP